LILISIYIPANDFKRQLVKTVAAVINLHFSQGNALSYNLLNDNWLWFKYKISL